jgi:hypothetical protein
MRRGQAIVEETECGGSDVRCRTDADRLEVYAEHHHAEATLMTSLTPQQISILRRVSDGFGLPAYVLRPRNCAQDVELLLFFCFIASGSRGLSIEPAGAEYLTRLDSAESQADMQPVGFRVAHERDHSISVEHWPQEF